jgi:hypothetical protein
MPLKKKYKINFINVEMNKEAVHILPTSKTPEIFLNPEGMIKITGRAIDESQTKFSDETTIWIDAYLINPPELTEVIIALEYLNSYNSIILAYILKKLSQITGQSKKLHIKWYIEEDDEDLLERGKYISSNFNITIEFILTDHIKSWY